MKLAMFAFFPGVLLGAGGVWVARVMPAERAAADERARERAELACEWSSRIDELRSRTDQRIAALEA